MASVVRRLGRWMTSDKESEETVQEDSKPVQRQSVDSYCSTLSGLESQASRSTQLSKSTQSTQFSQPTQSMKPNGSQEIVHSEPESPHQDGPRLQHKVSSMFSYFSDTLRSKTSIFHPPEKGNVPFEPSDFENAEKSGRLRSSSSAIFCPPETQEVTSGKSEFEAPKEPRNYSSIISSVRGRIIPSTSRGRETERGSLSSPTNPVRTTKEQPPRLDVKIPNSFLIDKPPREVSDLTALTRSLPNTRVPSRILNRNSETNNVTTLEEEVYNSKTESDAGKPDLDGFSPAVLKSTTPSLLGTGEELESEVGRARNSMTLPYRLASPFQRDTPALSSPKEIMCHCISPEDAFDPPVMSPRESCGDITSTTSALEPDTQSTERSLSSDVYKADAESNGTSPEHPSMGDRQALEQRRADRQARYLATTFDEPDTASDDNSLSELELSKVPTKHGTNEVQLLRDKLSRISAYGSKPFGYKDVPPAARDKSKVIDDRLGGLMKEIPAAKSSTIYHKSFPTGYLHHAIEANERVSGGTHWPIDLPYAVEAIERIPGDMLPTPTRNTGGDQRMPLPGNVDSIPSAPKYTMMSMRLTPEDIIKWSPRNPNHVPADSSSNWSPSEQGSKEEREGDWRNKEVRSSAKLDESPGTPCKVDESGSTLNNIKTLETEAFFGTAMDVTLNDIETIEPESLRAMRTDDSCAMTTQNPLFSAPPPFPDLHVRSVDACCNPKGVEALVKPKGAEIPIAGPNGLSIVSFAPLSPDDEANKRTTLLQQQKNPTPSATPNRVPSIDQDTKFWSEMMFKGKPDMSNEVEDSMNQFFGTSSQKAFGCSSLEPFAPMSCTMGRIAQNENEKRIPKPIQNPEFGIKRFESPEVKLTAYSGYELDPKLTTFFNQEWPATAKSASLVDSFRGRGQKTVCFAKDTEFINYHSHSDLSAGSPILTRPTKRPSISQTTKNVQKDLESKHEAAVNRLTLKLQEGTTNATEEYEAHRMEKPRWRVPGIATP